MARRRATDAVIAGRFRVLRTALSWAYDERLIDLHPIRYMRGPGRVPARQPLTDQQVRRLLATAGTVLVEAVANDRATPAARARRQAAEQDLLMVRLAADTGARRGELAALRRDDLDGRVLRLRQADSAGLLTTPKSGHGRVLTVGAGTARLWHARWTAPGRSVTQRSPSDPGCSAPTTPTSTASPRRRWATGSPTSEMPPASRAPPCTGSATTWPPSWWPAARSCRPRHASATPTRPPPCVSTPTPCR